MDMVTDTAERVAELLVHLGRIVRSETGGAGLTAAQWTCLRFFARANGNSRTPSGFASFQSTTRGTASQIVKTLERRALIERTRSDRDGRSVRFDLTADGRALLQDDPLRQLTGVIGGLAAPERAAFLGTLTRLVATLADRRAAPAFGTCRDCTHFSPHGNSGYCACMAAALAADDIDRLCAVFAPARGPDTPPDTPPDTARHEAQHTEGQHDAST